jgi:hypothetical protein
LVSASSSADPSQGLLHVNKIVKHLLWHLLPLNIHKPLSTGKHPLHCSSWQSPSEYHLCTSSTSGASVTAWSCFLFGNLGGTHWVYDKAACVQLLTCVDKIRLSSEEASKSVCTPGLHWLCQPFPSPDSGRMGTVSLLVLIIVTNVWHPSSNVRWETKLDSSEKKVYFHSRQNEKYTHSHREWEEKLTSRFRGETFAGCYFPISDINAKTLLGSENNKNLVKDVEVVRTGRWDTQTVMGGGGGSG